MPQIQAPDSDATLPAVDVNQLLTKGVKTSEFWLTLLGQLAALASQYQGFIPAPWGVAVAGGLGVVYTVVRFYLKKQAVAVAADIAKAPAPAGG